MEEQEKIKEIVQKVLKENNMKIPGYFGFTLKENKVALAGHFTIKELKLIAEMFTLINEYKRTCSNG